MVDAAEDQALRCFHVPARLVGASFIQLQIAARSAGSRACYGGRCGGLLGRILLSEDLHTQQDPLLVLPCDHLGLVLGDYPSTLKAKYALEKEKRDNYRQLTILATPGFLLPTSS